MLFTGNTDLPHYILNSIAIASGGTILAMVLTFPAAYAIVRYEVGKTWLLPLVTNIRALPLIIYAIPDLPDVPARRPARHADRPGA